MLGPTEQIDIYSTWYPWCQECSRAGWTIESDVLTSDGIFLCADCADDELAHLRATLRLGRLFQRARA